MGFKPRRARCFCCDRLVSPQQLERLHKDPWGEVAVCRDENACCAALAHHSEDR
jgi:hypothetical protein